MINSYWWSCSQSTKSVSAKETEMNSLTKQEILQLSVNTLKKLVQSTSTSQSLSAKGNILERALCAPHPCTARPVTGQLSKLKLLPRKTGRPCTPVSTRSPTVLLHSSYSLKAESKFFLRLPETKEERWQTGRGEQKKQRPNSFPGVSCFPPTKPHSTAPQGITPSLG